MVVVYAREYGRAIRDPWDRSGIKVWNIRSNLVIYFQRFLFEYKYFLHALFFYMIFSFSVFAACTASQFKCGNGQCIDSDDRCNNVEDCLDRSDELNCREYIRRIFFSSVSSCMENHFPRCFLRSVGCLSINIKYFVTAALYSMYSMACTRAFHSNNSSQVLGNWFCKNNPSVFVGGFAPSRLNNS